MPFAWRRNETDEPECMGGNKGRQHPPVGEGVMQKMSDYYRPYNEVLFWMLGEDLGWNNAMQAK